MAVPSVATGRTVIADFNNGGTGYDSVQFGTGNLSGTPSNMTSANSVTAGGAFNDDGVNDSGCVGTRSNFGVNASTTVTARYFDVSADLTNDICAIHAQFTSSDINNCTQTAGVAFGFCSNNDATQAAYWVLGGGQSPLPDWGVSLIDPTKSDTAAYHSGTFDPANVTQVIFGANFALGLRNCMFDELVTLSPYVLTAGEVANPGSFADFIDQFNTDNVNLVSNYSDLAYLCYFSPQIGDGTNFTYYRDTLRIIEFTKESDFTGTPYCRGHIDAGALGFYIDASATDDIDIDQYVVLSPLGYECDLQAASGATVLLNNFIFDNATTFTLGDNITLNSPTISNCAEISATSPTISGGTISNGAGLNVTSTANMSGISFTDNSKALIVDVAGTASMTLDGCTFSGNIIDVEYTGTGTLTLSLANGSNPDALKESTPNGGTIVYSGGGATLTLTGLVAGSEVRIYETGTATELTGVESSGTSFAYAYSSTQDVDIVIHKEDYKYIRIDSYTLGSSDASIPIQQVFDRNYSNPA